MIIFFYKGLTRNLNIGNNPVWELPKIWRLTWVSDTRFGTDVSNELILRAAKCQGYGFYHFWVIKGKISPHHSLQIRVKLYTYPYRANTKLVQLYICDTARSFNYRVETLPFNWFGSTRPHIRIFLPDLSAGCPTYKF